MTADDSDQENVINDMQGQESHAYAQKVSVASHSDVAM
jgi:hypothetical protein